MKGLYLEDKTLTSSKDEAYIYNDLIKETLTSFMGTRVFKSTYKYDANG